MPVALSPDDAAPFLPVADRVMVIGVSGAGKTTLSRHLAHRFGLPYVSLDADIRWLPGWRMRHPADQRRLIARFATRPRWIMDGTSVHSLDLRIPRADLVIWLRPPPAAALTQVTQRLRANHGRVPPDPAHLRSVWTFETTQSPSILAALDMHGPDTPLVILHDHDATARMLDGAG